jgi:hypothetical protein
VLLLLLPRVLLLLLLLLLSSIFLTPLPSHCATADAYCKVKSHHTNAARQQVPHCFLCIAPAAAVAMAVHHHWQLVITRPRVHGQVVADHDLLPSLVPLQPWQQRKEDRKTECVRRCLCVVNKLLPAPKVKAAELGRVAADPFAVPAGAALPSLPLKRLSCSACCCKQDAGQ